MCDVYLRVRGDEIGQRQRGLAEDTVSKYMAVEGQSMYGNLYKAVLVYSIEFCDLCVFDLFIGQHFVCALKSYVSRVAGRRARTDRTCAVPQGGRQPPTHWRPRCARSEHRAAPQLRGTAQGGEARNAWRS